jgi:hypothetical protein
MGGKEKCRSDGQWENEAKKKSPDKAYKLFVLSDHTSWTHI